MKDALSQAQVLEEQMNRLRLLNKQQLAQVSKEKAVLESRLEECENKLQKQTDLKAAAEESAAR